MSDDVRLATDADVVDLISDDGGGDDDGGPCSPILSDGSLSGESGCVTNADAFAEIADEIARPDHDCLTVLCKGISPANLIVACIVNAGTKPTDLILLFNLSSSSSDISSKLNPLEQELGQRLASLSPALPMTKVSSAVPVTARQRLYIAGHIFSMPLATAALDLIQGVLPGHLIKGLIFVDAHKIVDGSREALLIRLVRDHCRDRPFPFLKLFATNVAALQNSYNQMERILHTVGIIHVHLWPRFRVRLRRCLSRTTIDDVTVSISLTDLQKQIQDAIKEVLETCLVEAQNSCKRYLADVNFPTDQLLAAQHDLRLRRLLRPKWHHVGQKTRQLVSDLALLRKLFFLLATADCVSFYRFLLSIQQTPRTQHSQWLLTAPADRLFKLAKRRIYSVSIGPKLHINLQPNPKWAILRQILDEIASDGLPRSGPVLIVCSDSASCAAVQEYLSVGAPAFLSKRWLQFLQSLRLGNPSASEDNDAGDEVAKAFAAKRIERRLLAEELRCLRDAKPSRPDEPKQAALARFGVGSSKAAAKKTAAKVPAKRGRKKPRLVPIPPTTTTCEAAPPRSATLTLQEALTWHAPADPVVILDDAPDLPILLWPKKNDYIPLATINPMYVIVYDSDVGVLRELEMAKSRDPGILHRIYTILYEDSIEDTTHHDQIRRECNDFEALAQQKARLVPPSLTLSSTSTHSATASVENTRRGGGVAAAQQIIVDIREFRSSVPGVLYEAGVQVVPVTLEVGDYILTPEICVERKSIPDLVGSLNSGRLFAQLTAMKRYYQHPFLLIEFEAHEPFSLQQDLHDRAGSTTSSQITTRLAMICLAFPEIRIIWSRSPRATADIFSKLKAGRAQPDVAKAATIAIDEEAEQDGSYVATDMLKRLPGVAPANLRTLIKSATCLADLVCADKGILAKVLGANQAAILAEFLTTDMAP